jgi:NitT/TauT family transport system substrate-binding protein
MISMRLMIQASRNRGVASDAPRRGGLARLGLATLALLCLTAAPVHAQTRPAAKVRYSEVVRSLLYAPAYVAISRGYFRDAGIDLTMTTAQGGDKAMAALLGNGADIALIGPETTVYVKNSESPTKVKIFAGLTATDGFVLMSRTKPAMPFDWNTLKGKDILGFRPGSTPLLYLEAALRKHKIDPARDVKLANNIGVPARYGSWLAGQNQYAIFIEPDAAQLELDGKAWAIASIGEEVGFADYTAFMATERFIRERPEVVQGWTDAILRAQKWTEAASTAEMVKTLAEFFPGVNAQTLGFAIERYRRTRMWKTSPLIDPAAIERFQDILVQGGVLEQGKRVRFDDLVTNEFARKAVSGR